MSEEEKSDKGFQVSDRRRFTGEGDQRPEGSSSEQRAEPQTQAAPEAPAEPTAEKKASEEQTRKQKTSPSDLPEINFATFIFSLSSSVLIHLGVAPDPLSGEKRQDLALAKQTIDILKMLQEKTKGNLTDDERQLMEGILYDLRMQYVSESKKVE